MSCWESLLPQCHQQMMRCASTIWRWDHVGVMYIVLLTVLYAVAGEITVVYPIRDIWIWFSCLDSRTCRCEADDIWLILIVYVNAVWWQTQFLFAGTGIEWKLFGTIVIGLVRIVFALLLWVGVVDVWLLWLDIGCCDWCFHRVLHFLLIQSDQVNR